MISEYIHYLLLQKCDLISTNQWVLLIKNTKIDFKDLSFLKTSLAVLICINKPSSHTCKVLDLLYHQHNNISHVCIVFYCSISGVMVNAIAFNNEYYHNNYMHNNLLGWVLGWC